jgi:hypothetical protein
MPQTENSETVRLFRVENPNIPARPNGTTSHEDLIGQWFSPNLDSALRYLRKSTQRFGKETGPVEGARLLVAELPTGKVESHHVSKHPIASSMDVEGNNYLLPRDGSIPTTVIELDETLGELRGQLGNVKNLLEAQQRIHVLVDTLGATAIK